MSRAVVLTDDPVYPSERAQHDPVRRVAKTVADSDGNIGDPFRVVDMLGRMRDRGAITEEMCAAGYVFRDTFRLAQLDPLKAADVSRPVVSGSCRAPDGARIDAARREVVESLRLLGSGPHMACRSCAWNVLGFEKSLRQWAAEYSLMHRPISKDQATGVLISVLEILAVQGGW